MEFDIETIKLHIECAKNYINNMFDTLLSKNTNKANKRAHLISYWLKDYSKYILTEDEFNPASLIHYKRGNIIQVEFGYRVGSELGGRHYAVVIDNNNDLHSDTITVVPLKSLKDTYKNNRFSFILKNGLYEIYSNDIDKKIIKLKQKLKNITENEINLLTIDEHKKEINKIKSQIDKLDNEIKKLDNLKRGTVVNVSQITTISKMRISSPKTRSDSLYGLKLSNEDLDMLNSMLKKLYIYNDIHE